MANFFVDKNKYGSTLTDYKVSMGREFVGFYLNAKSRDLSKSIGVELFPLLTNGQAEKSDELDEDTLFAFPLVMKQICGMPLRPFNALALREQSVFSQVFFDKIPRACLILPAKALICGNPERFRVERVVVRKEYMARKYRLAGQSKTLYFHSAAVLPLKLPETMQLTPETELANVTAEDVELEAPLVFETNFLSNMSEYLKVLELMEILSHRNLIFTTGYRPFVDVYVGVPAGHTCIVYMAPVRARRFSIDFTSMIGNISKKIRSD